ncbi:insulinase family protein [Sphingomonas aliaeris]|uniref:Insulinase family protein n=1 Tax=Sphingomonas aliaeris TaxID=2759526 RepID=A0A974NUV2_9SPHN|nr:pitrilysin family protein [Sphingomonas aliaeris]QQV77403.1 insulinase family protein [Sphingomonas aliaeris]
MAKKTGTRLTVLLSMVAASALASGATGAKRTQQRPPAPAKHPAKPLLGPAALALERLEIKFEKFTLPNGLTVIVYPDHSQKKVYVSTTYRVGSKDEPEGKSGFAHLFEHLMFQETSNRKGEFFTPLRDNGVFNMNGNTTTDRTRYFESVPTNELDLALWMESDRMQYLLGAVDQAALDSQRAVVKNEKRQNESAASAAQSAAYLAAMYPKGHPYAHGVIGSMTDLDNAKLADVREWFDSYYGAANAILLLAGDIDVATAREKVGHYFKDVRPGQRIQEIAEWIPTMTPGRRLRFYDKTANRRITRSWPVPHGHGREGVLLSTFAATLFGTPDSPLNRALVENDGPALSAFAMYSDSQVNGIFSVSVELKPGADLALVERKLDTVMADALRAGPDAGALKDYLANKDEILLSAFVDADVLGGMLEAGELEAGDPLLFKTARRWENDATTADIAATARNWLQRPYLTTETFPEARSQPPTAGSVDRKTMPAVPPTVATLEFPPIEQATLANGAKVVVVRRPKLPMVDVSIQFATGKYIDRPYAPDLASFTFGSIFDASARHPADRIAGRMRELSISPSASAGDRRSSIQFSTISPRLDEAMDFVSEVVREPAFPQKKIDEYMMQVGPSYDTYEDNPAGAQDTLFSLALWGTDHPNGKIDTRETVRAINRDKMVDFYNKEVGPANMTVYFVGDITLDHARTLVERNFAQWHLKARPAGTIDAPPARPTGVKVVLIDVPGAQQSNIMAGRLIEPWSMRRAMTEILSNGPIGGAFTSRINLNLREDKGWTYCMSTGLGNSIRSQRTFYVKGSVQTDATTPAIKEITKEIEAYITTRPMTDSELTIERDNLMNSFAPFLSSNGAYMTAITDADARGMPLDFVRTTPDVVRSITLQEARDLAKQDFRSDDFVWTIAGDLQRIEADIRALNLGPVEVQDVYGHRIR